MTQNRLQRSQTVRKPNANKLNSKAIQFNLVDSYSSSGESN